jgi:hypothetical protein
VTTKNDMELMERFDGEIHAPGSTMSAADEAKMRGLVHVSEAVRGHLELQAEELRNVDSDAMWSAIDRALDLVKPSVTTSAPAKSDKTPVPRSVTNVSAAESTGIVVEDRSSQPRTGPVRSESSAANAGIWGWLGQHRSHFVTAAASAGVVAGLALWLRPTQTSAVAPAPAPVAVKVPASDSGQPKMIPAIMPADLAKPTDIESLDVPDGSGTVMTITDDDGETAVIWISPNEVEGI